MGTRCRVAGCRLSGWLAAALVTAVLMACGGSGGGDMAGVGTGGTGTVSSVVSMGPISGFGSVIVAGVRYDDSHAVVTDEEGNVRGRDALKLGMVTTIRGSADFVAGSGVAESIRYGSELVEGVVKQSTARAPTNPPPRGADRHRSLALRRMARQGRQSASRRRFKAREASPSRPRRAYTRARPRL